MLMRPVVKEFARSILGPLFVLSVLSFPCTVHGQGLASSIPLATQRRFFAAVKTGDLTTVKKLIEDEKSLVSAREKSNHGATALHVAKTVEIAKFLLDSGAGLEALDTEHWATPLRWAVCDERKDVAKFLRERGAKIEDIYLAAAYGDLDLVKKFLDGDAKLLEAPGKKCDPLGDGEHVKDPNEPGTARPLIVAVVAKQYAVVKFLIAKGADVNARGAYAFATPLHDAAFSGNAQIAQLLILSRADIEAFEEKHQGTPLQWAIASGKKSTVKVLLDAGAKVTANCIDTTRSGKAGGLKGISSEPPATFKEIEQMMVAAQKGDKKDEPGL